MRNYICLPNSVFEENSFALVPIRDEDKYEILEMRNEQMYHLRQAKPLAVEDQEHYFKNVVSKLFELQQPDQLLFSLLKEGKFIGYGGLVHINWIDRNAEISFIMKTELEQDNFEYFWKNYLSLLNKLAFKELNFHKIYTYAFDLRPHLYQVIEKAGFVEEARLKEHCFFEGKFLDVLIHTKINSL
ncbi:MAG: GNAT family N-acetyltransferase [Flavobacterium sp.]|nr:GNAT family N-acetyltransferase [Flavobacterium sp.]MCX6294282.1 GNAT family N-acetyltransferase [Sphingobacteriales bacterium]